MKTDIRESERYRESVSGFWERVRGNGIVTGAYSGIGWAELPEHAQVEVAALFEVAIGRDSRELLACLGFVRGSGFAGEVWTNPNSEHLVQVWVSFEGTDDASWGLWWDASGGLDVAAFFKWWDEKSASEYLENP